MSTSAKGTKGRKWLVVIVLAIVVSIATAAYFCVFYYYNVYEVLNCCLPPVIENGQSYSPEGWDYCQLGKSASVAVCQVGAKGGESGNITLIVGNKGGSRVNFAIYSSEPLYIDFTSTPACAYTSPPNLNDPNSCLVPANSPQTFQFIFRVSPSYKTSAFVQPTSITIVMYQTCCFG